MIEKLKAFLNLNQIQFKSIKGNRNVITFSIGNLNFLAEYNKEQDPTFFRMMLPCVAKFENNPNTSIQIIKSITSRYKCGKVIIIGDYIWLSVESFIFGNIDAPNLFSIMIKVLRDMINEYRRINHD